MDQLQLGKGAHESAKHGMCAMEMVAFFAQERHSDTPQCACPVIGAFVRRLNDRLGDEQRQRLKEYIPALALSRASWPVTLKRAFLAADFAVRDAAPRALEARGKKSLAAQLRALPEIVDAVTARRAKIAAAATNAADDATAAAADAAAFAAAAATNAADDATAAAADAAAFAANVADDKHLADSGIALIERMLAVRE